ncbi:MAG: hypothetical protein JNM10_01730 [Planctomycetia bacterium]|nr:hypothetical protein [Planctomycetia bacterium]
MTRGGARSIRPGPGRPRRAHACRPGASRLGAIVTAWIVAATTGVGGGARRATAGPLEARQRWKEAQALDAAPWRDRLAAFRAVRREAAPTDGYAARALLAEARVLREAAYRAAAAATEAVAANGGGRRDPDRLGHALSAARALVADEDARGARPLLLDVVEAGGSSAPAFTGPALELLGRLASDRGDDDALARLVRRAADETPERWDTRLRLLDLVGLRALRRGARDDAERALKEQKRLFTAARREGEAAERVAGRAWLGLELPKLLDTR